MPSTMSVVHGQEVSQGPKGLRDAMKRGGANRGYKIARRDLFSYDLSGFQNHLKGCRTSRGGDRDQDARAARIMVQVGQLGETTARFGQIYVD